MKNVLILITLFFFGSCSSEAVIVDTENIDKVFLKNATIQYKTTTSDPNLTSLDIYTVQNSNSEKPVVIWVHGGGWAIGDKANGIEKKASFFYKSGLCFCCCQL